MKIKIQGAGVGGLTTAIALKKKGFDVDVYERHEGRSDIGAGIVCWPNASFVLKELGMLDDIALQSGLPVKMRRISNDGSNLGALNILKLNEKMGYPSFSILRKDLMKVLESHLTECGVEVKYGNTIEKLVSSQSGSTSIHFENGATSHADIIIGADGRMSSVARAFVNGDNRPVYQGFINWIGVYESNEPIFFDIEVRDYWGVGERFGIVPISSTKAYWAGGVAALKVGDKAPSSYKADLLTLFQDWPSPIETIINETSLADLNKIYVHDHNPMKTWHRDNVLVIGDAAHAPLPTSGQGACQAIEDAWHIAELLENHNGDLESLFQEFTKIRFPKTTGITMGARQFASSLFGADENASEQRNNNSINTDYNAVINGMAKGWSSGLPICV
ncbi:MAG: NAD(P)-binding protein [Gammaproteobacteria bacterium]|nr:NAD(P)-binding protein [Gammaproteobacteria bacterium]